MPILALDTTSLASSVAIAAPETLLIELTVQIKKTHSEQLMPHIASILGMAQIKRQELRAVAVSIGPGSFTGLRIGLATAKALAYALRIPIVGVSTLTALAYSCPAPDTIIAPMLDAQKGNIYQAHYRWENGMPYEVRAAGVINCRAALAELAKMDEPAVVLGEAAVLYRDLIAEYAGRIMLAPPHVAIPRAGSIALLAQGLLAQGIHHDVATLEPLYIRRSEAEELWEQRQGRK